MVLEQVCNEGGFALVTDGRYVVGTDANGA